MDRPTHSHHKLSNQAIVIDKYPQWVTRSDQNIHPQVNLETIQEEWLQVRIFKSSVNNFRNSYESVANEYGVWGRVNEF